MSRYIRFLSPAGTIHYGVPIGDVQNAKQAHIIKGDVFGSCEVCQKVETVERILEPINPVQIYAIGLNYRKHAAEAHLTIPRVPAVFMKSISSVTGPYDPIRIPDCCASKPEVDYEGELVIVMGKDCKNVSVDHALDFIHGYCIGNDVSARRWQGEKLSSGQWTRSKSFDTFSPLGPQVILAQSLGTEVNNLNIRTELNNVVMQNSNTSDMVWSVSEIVSFLSQGTTIPKGTIIFTGTPEGVGFIQNPYVYLKKNDVVKVSIDKVGFIENVVECSCE